MAVTQLPKAAATKGQEQVEAHVATDEAAAAFLAGGIGCFVLALVVVMLTQSLGFTLISASRFQHVLRFP